MATHLMKTPAKNFEIPVPDKPMLGGQAKTLIMENQKAKILVDYIIPTDGKINYRRPDVTVYIKSQRRVEVFEVAVARDEGLCERGKQKKQKYLLSRQNREWKVSMRPIVIGCMGSIVRAGEMLRDTKIFTEQEVNSLVREMQMEALVSAVRIMRHQLYI